MALSILAPITSSPSYRAAYWFLHDCIRRFRARLALITISGFVSAGLQGASLGLLHTALSGPDERITLYLSRIGIDESLAFPIAVALIMTALIGAAVLAYVQGWLVLRLWRTYQFHSVNRVLGAVKNAVRRGVDVGVVGEGPVLAVLRQSQRLGAFIRIVGASIAAGLRFLAFGMVAVYTDPLLTLILIAVTIPSAGLALLYFARRASRASRHAASVSRDAGFEITRLLQRALAGNAATVTPDASGGASPFVDRARAITDRVLFAEQAKLAAGFITMVSLGSFIGYMYVTEQNSGSANTMFVYALALLLAFRQLIIVATSISTFGRFYPAVQAQQELLDALENASSTADFRARLQRLSISKLVAEDDEEFDGGL